MFPNLGFETNSGYYIANLERFENSRRILRTNFQLQEL